MKKKWYFIIGGAILLIGLIFLVKLNYNKPYEEKPNNTIIVGGIDDMEPYSYVDRQGKYTGFNVEVMNLIAEELDVNIIYKNIKIENIIDELESGRVDLVLGAQYGSGSFDELRYTKPFIKNYFNIYVDNSTNNIRRLGDLENKIVSVYRWDPAYQRVKDIKGIRLYVCNSQRDAYAFLKNGMADAYVANGSLAFNYIEEPLYNRKIKIVGGKIDALPSGAVTLKSNDELTEFINKGIDKVKNNKKIDQLYEKWFGSKIVEKQTVLYRIIYAVLIFGILLVIIVVIITRLNQILKKEVRERTLEIQKEMDFKMEIVNSITDLLITISNDYIITTLNNKLNVFEIIDTFIKIGENIKNTHIIDIIGIDNIENVLNGTCEKMQGEKKIIINRIDNYFEYSVTKIAINNEIIGSTIIIKDITSKVIMENKLIMKDKMRTIGQLTAGIAHEIRNPLTTIDLYIDLLPQRIDNADFRRQIIEDLPLEVKRINNIVEDLLNYAKPNFPNIVSFNVRDEIEDIVRLRKKNIDFGNLVININIDSELCINFDKNNFRQIIINLLSNAIDSVKLEESPKIMIYTHEHDKIYEIIVEDNGPGIVEKNIEKIFEPLFTTKKEGNGLGLAIVSQLVKENNSSINVQSNINEGTKFTMSVVK